MIASTPTIAGGRYKVLEMYWNGHSICVFQSDLRPSDLIVCVCGGGNNIGLCSGGCHGGGFL